MRIYGTETLEPASVDNKQGNALDVRKRALILLTAGTKFEGTGHFDCFGRASIRRASTAAV